jgi:hypothetical protein
MPLSPSVISMLSPSDLEKTKLSPAPPLALLLEEILEELEELLLEELLLEELLLEELLLEELLLEELLLEELLLEELLLEPYLQIMNPSSVRPTTNSHKMVTRSVF